MVTAILHPELIWHLDRRQDDRCRIGKLLEGLHPQATVRALGDYWQAHDAFAEAQQRGDYPWLVVSDRVGLEKPHDKPAIAELFRDIAPLVLFALCSDAAFGEGGPINDWQRLKLIVAAFRKRDASIMVEQAQTWLQRWNLPVLMRFREYIIHECPDPETAYFPTDDYRNLLSVYDLHREMIRGTALGLEQEQVWNSVLSGDLSLFGTAGGSDPRQVLHD